MNLVVVGDIKYANFSETKGTKKPNWNVERGIGTTYDKGRWISINSVKKKLAGKTVSRGQFIDLFNRLWISIQLYNWKKKGKGSLTNLEQCCQKVFWILLAMYKSR